MDEIQIKSILIILQKKINEAKESVEKGFNRANQNSINKNDIPGFTNSITSIYQQLEQALKTEGKLFDTENIQFKELEEKIKEFGHSSTHPDDHITLLEKRMRQNNIERDELKTVKSLIRQAKDDLRSIPNILVDQKKGNQHEFSKANIGIINRAFKGAFSNLKKASEILKQLEKQLI